MFYRTREWIDERLRLARRQSYRLIPATPSGRIRDDGVIALLNRSRVGIEEPLCSIPCDLMTPNETISRYAESGITDDDLRRWTRRTRHAPPHFRLNRQTLRFPASMLERWLQDNSIRRRTRT